ncbi:ATP synthase F0 subunit C [Limnochorda pilosa]|uniref:ATP synthase F(0) sector subunit c n=1 Tax=Limnochorda pilosa TaxID=1555112 RepID=A0A0K2SP73_LIMPI|nr:ATP synthase F0 subunit C [Limnochorda pilosa]BAS28920.1 F0F1 ATP synthase subunit C [Limnochorda pilosa]
MELLSVALAIALPAMMSAFSQGWATTHAMDSMGRQPEAAGDIRSTLLVALAFMEALTLFAMIVAILVWTKI